MESQHEFLEWLRTAGFTVNPNIRVVDSEAAVHEFCKNAWNIAATSTTTSTASS